RLRPQPHERGDAAVPGRRPAAGAARRGTGPGDVPRSPGGRHLRRPARRRDHGPRRGRGRAGRTPRLRHGEPHRPPPGGRDPALHRRLRGLPGPAPPGPERLPGRGGQRRTGGDRAVAVAVLPGGPRTHRTGGVGRRGVARTGRQRGPARPRGGRPRPPPRPPDCPRRAEAESGGPGETARWLWLSCPVAPEPIAPEVWDDEAWHELADSAVRLARGAGALASLPVALSYRAGVHLQAGEFAEAAALIE